MRPALLILLLSLLSGCASTHTRIIKSDRAIVRWSYDSADGTEWQREILRKTGKLPVVFVCHGGVSLEYQGSGKWERRWYAFPDGPRPATKVDSIAWMLRDEYGPDVPILLLTCNPGHFSLNVPNCWYSTENIMSRPLHIPFSWNESISSFEELKWSGWDDFSTPTTQPTSQPSTQPAQ